MVSSAPPPYVKDNDELQDFILDMFLKFDADESGYLDRKEFKR